MTASSWSRAFAARLANRGRDALARRVGIDPRALAAFRVSLGGLLVADLTLRSRDLVAFYTDAGVLPRTALRELYPVLGSVTPYALSSGPWVQAALFLVATGFALALLVGYRTTLATAVSLVLLASLHARNPLVLNGGDSLLLHLLFWGLFLPLGERWSVDARREGLAPTRDDSDQTRGRGQDDSDQTRGRGQDDSDPGRRLVTSVASAALLVQVVLVYAVNAVLKLRGELWLGGEAVRYVFALDQFTVLFGDLLANYPGLLELLAHLWLGMVVSSVLLVGLTGRARAAFVALFVGAHLGMAATLRLGLFPLVSVASLLPFFPPLVWDAVERGVASERSGTDAIAPKGATAVSFPRLPPRPASIETLSRWARRLRAPAVACLLVAMAGWNAAVVGVVDSNGAVTADDTPWNMFAPDPMRTSGWYVAPGELASGERVDALHERPVRWDRPPDVAATYPNDRWRKYLKHLRYPPSADQRPAFAGYLCDRWDRRHDDELVAVSLYFVAEPTRLDGPEPTDRVELGSYSCSAVGDT